MSQDTEQLIALAPWAAFCVAVLIFGLIDVRDRLRDHRRNQPVRVARERARVPLDHTG